MTDLFVHGPPGIRVNNVDDGKLKKTKKRPEPLKLKHKKSQTHMHAPTQPLSRILRHAGNLVLSWRDGLTESEREDKRRLEERMQILAARMHNATSMADWEAAAKELDTLEGNDEWKLDDASGDYAPNLIKAKLKELDTARTNCDIGEMMYLIRTALSRDLGGMGNIDLYRHSYIGTKKLIERYVDSAVQTIEDLVEKSAYSIPPGMESKDLLEGMLYARQSFGRSALLLSGGATFGMSHIGVLKALYEQRLLPRIISGASAGSIVCAVLCSRKDEEIPALVEAFPYGDLGVFESEGDSLADNIRRLLTEGSWADISNLTRVMRSWLGDVTFQEAYNRTRRICNICVSSASIYELPRLLNYITAPNVMIWSAVAASCSVPLVFQAATLLVKDPVTGAHVPWNPTPQHWIDGSVDNDLPMTRLAEMFNVNHFIVSQVNPHVVPFLAKDDRLYPATTPGKLRQSKASQDNSEWLYTLTALAKDEALHRLHFLTELGIFPNLFTKLRCILSQKYSGDITILPEIAVQDLPLILKNPTPEFMMRNCLIGERATWPKLSRIRDRLAIELALDQAVHTLRARVVFSKSQVDLRRMAATSEAQVYYRNGFHSRGASAEVKTPSSSRPICCVHQPYLGEATPDEKPNRRRRSSGGSIQLLAARHKMAFQEMDSDMTDDLSEEDERLEMNFRRGSRVVRTSVNPRTINSKPRLKRASRSHSHLQAGMPTMDYRLSQMHHPNLPCFDFSKPMSPPTHTGHDSAVGLDDNSALEDIKGGSLTSPSPPVDITITSCSSPPLPEEVRGGIHHSDADVDSDSDPYHNGNQLPTKELSPRTKQKGFSVAANRQAAAGLVSEVIQEEISPRTRQGGF
ncbi:acyl transferase/acyl hydrolase/lysophospholipase [Podospora fimiseda]|uniref:Patatin-like phospholipase domain-containing protein n=1 Tax=Podospora fimiseda TaxID=252190 RepID=A0AAN7BIC8_9PEZI|nr:acyl transferase/acyl hydrolase/lysophospholipase [Podospora fimiseda]